MDDPREMARLFLGNAVGFQSVARHVADKDDWPCFPWPPFFVIVGHAVELSLKAFILNRGGTEQECRNIIGHDLRKALQRCRELGLELSSSDVTVMIDRIATSYGDHSFRYLRNIPVRDLPDANETLAALEQLVRAVVAQSPNLLPE